MGVHPARLGGGGLSEGRGINYNLGNDNSQRKGAVRLQGADLAAFRAAGSAAISPLGSAALQACPVRGAGLRAE